MIELKDISKVFNRGMVNEITALSDISLSVKKEDFLVVVGANGSGKTTLLNIISGAEKTTSGKIIIDGIDVTSLPEHKRSKWIARVFQNPYNGTASDLTILDNFRLAAIRTTNKQLKIGINEAFKKQVRDKITVLGMGLENKIEQALGNLSGGQRQALTLLMSVMDSTKILLLDEPTAALDPRSASVIMQTADKLIKEYKLTAVLITHNLKEAHQYGNRLIQMGEGKIVRDYSSEEKGTHPLQEMVEWFG